MNTPKDDGNNPASADPVTPARPDPLTPGQTISGQPAFQQAESQDAEPGPAVTGQAPSTEDQQGPERTESAPGHNTFSFSHSEAAAPAPPPWAMNIGSVLARSFSALCANPAVFLGLAILAAIPSCFLLMLLPPRDEIIILVRVLGFICSLVVQGATAYALVRMLLGGTAGLGESIVRGMTRIGPLAGAALLMGIGTALGLGLFLLPGLFLLCLWSVTIPVCAVEKLGPLKSMKRSAELTKNYRMTIFALILINVLIVMAVTVAAGGLVVTFVSSPFIAGMLLTLILAAPQAFSNIMVSVIYCDLRSIKDGAPVESLDRAFA